MAHEKRSVATRSGNIAYVERGEGPAALFVHGIFLNSHLWRHVTARLETARRCIALDLLSHGDSPASPGQDISFRGQAKMLADFLDALDLADVDLVANDSGGAIAQIFAARHPGRVRTLALTNCDVHDNYPPPALGPTMEAARKGRFSAHREAYLADIERFRRGFEPAYETVDQVEAESLDAYLRPLLSSPERTRDLERWLVGSEDNSQTTEIAPLLRKLEVPTLIVWGTDDVYFPVKWAYWLSGAIPGVRKLIELEGARLFFPEERPDALAEALREHWRAAQAAPPGR
jgi:pimeloyl-ACP methyl ester carboxylesterase